MLRVGITGGIGSGKTTVCRIFESLNIPVYYADDRAKYLITHNEAVKSGIIDLLGEEAYIDGVYNRKYVANIVFNDKEKLIALNSIVHPAVGMDVEEWFESQESPYALQEAALLVENGSYLGLDRLISVSAPKDIRMERVMSRDDITEEQVNARFKSQLPQEEKDKVADYIIDNSGRYSLVMQVVDIHKALLQTIAYQNGMEE